MSDSYLYLDRITKAFPGVCALDEVSFSVQKGDIHAIVGENGAGKSTLMKILAGIYPYGTYSGNFSINGQPCRFENSLRAEAAGVVLIPQELAVVNELSVAENMFLNMWPTSFGRINWKGLNQRAQDMIDKLGINVDPSMPIKKLGAAKQQLVLIAKALSKSARILILDEPTSSLSESDREVLFDCLLKLKEQGITSLYISHKLEEIMSISDKVTVLRDGRHVATQRTSDLEQRDIVRLMVGRPFSQMYPREPRIPGKTVLEIKNATLYHPDLADKKVVDDVSLELRSGEIVGLYGLIGSGRTALLQSIFGAWPGKAKYSLFRIRGKDARILSPRDAMSQGIGLLTEDRKRSGIIEGKSIKSNITVSCLERITNRLIINPIREREITQRLVGELKIRTPSIETNIEALSGGNQQKVLIARWLAAEADILLLDEPTRGIDVGAKVEIFHLLNRLAANGAAIIFVSSELPEVLGISDRILVMHEGRLKLSLSWQVATEEKIMHYATGHISAFEETHHER